MVKNLTRELQTEFSGRNGFSGQNLWLMRQLVNEYTAKPKLQSLIVEISWTKNLLIMARLLGIATYSVPQQLHASFQGELPSPEQIAERWAGCALVSDGFEGEGV